MHTHILICSQYRYVNCASMAARSVAAVRDGDLKIVPEMHEATWYRWLDNIRYVLKLHVCSICTHIYKYICHFLGIGALVVNCGGDIVFLHISPGYPLTRPQWIKTTLYKATGGSWLALIAMH